MIPTDFEARVYMAMAVLFLILFLVMVGSMRKGWDAADRHEREAKTSARRLVTMTQSERYWRDRAERAETRLFRQELPSGQARCAHAEGACDCWDGRHVDSLDEHYSTTPAATTAAVDLGWGNPYWRHLGPEHRLGLTQPERRPPVRMGDVPPMPFQYPPANWATERTSQHTAPMPAVNGAAIDEDAT